MKSNSFCVGGHHDSSTKSIGGDTTKTVGKTLLDKCLTCSERVNSCY